MADATTLDDVVAKGNDLLGAFAQGMNSIPGVAEQAMQPYLDAAAALPSLNAAYANKALGRAAVSNNQIFWVRPNPTDSLTRYSAFERLTADTDRLVVTLAAASDVDSIFLTKELTFRALAPESGYLGGFFDSTNRAAWLVTLDGTFVPSKSRLPATRTFLSDDLLTPLVNRLVTAVQAEVLARLGSMPPESGYLFALPGLDGKSPLSVTLLGEVIAPLLRLAASSVGLAQLKDDVKNRLVPSVPRVLTPEITGVSPNRKLYVNDNANGVRYLITDQGDPRDPTTTDDGHVLFYNDSGYVHSAVPPKGIHPVFPNKRVSVFGDSLMQSTGTNWPVNIMAPLIGMDVSNWGWSGAGTEDIAVRQGGWGPAVTILGNYLAANTIPASGSVAVTVSPDTGYRLGGTSPTWSFTGVLAGVPGTLVRTVQDRSWVFTRTTAGAPVNCPPGTVFVSDIGVASRGDIQIWSAGRNNVSHATFEQDILDFHAKALAYITPYVKRRIHLSVTNGTNEIKGTASYNKIVQVNEKLKALYGEHYFDLRRYFIDFGLQDAGIEPTEEDMTAIENDTPPPSLMSDLIHPTSQGYGVFGRAVANVIISKGWNL